MAAPSVEDVLIHVLPNFGIDSIKTEQKVILECLVSKKNCVAVLPTGFGKSLPFQLYLPVVREICENSSDWKVLVCCPLVALMQDQVEKLSHIANLSAAYKGSSSQIDDNIKDGLIDIIYASPETLVGDPEWRNCLKKLNIKVIVIDEFHTIAIWGQGEGGRKEAFRKWFGNIGELRSLFPEATVLALSATCTVNIRQKVMKILQLTDDTKEINMSPNKSNIKLVSSKIKNEIEMGMTWLVDALDEKKGDFPRTIIYCSSINDTSKLYKYITTELPSCTKYVEMFHSETPDSNKNMIIHALKDEGSAIRIILSTSALGMGFDVKMCNSVILFGPPNNLVDMLQEIGRVGRDGNPSVAIILYNGYHQQKLSPEVKAILRTKECRRKELMSNFLRNSDLHEMESKECGKHSCCDLCASRCSCNSCTLLPLEKLFLAEHVVEEGHDDSFSDSDTESYNLSEYDYFEDLDLGLLEIQDD
ncbi:bifunctional 3'-5' exonuclease/ATP-dependent helicase WRN-like [Mytilus californianus]|uniref:bifunctional 3'-5' exonuclease/ATP-dependent helicase WRN-like n=1 Tax=Mytilus californianus TaxID=6549 RepID=UPI002246044A|nr:bifunctional 3'-5' exonuclease/ATP-dependent helicase WRN-like [Mytilus californianus]XP_052062842.1 bifunctional 3'-5' exonuclease/ATP-dependent helicase WRN-like [Mytilus californianus]